MRITFDIPTQLGTWRSLVRLPQWVRSGWQWWRASHQRSRHIRAVHALELASDARVVELCFGAGVAIADLLAAAPEGRVVGVDPAAHMVRKARHTFRPWVESGQLTLFRGSPCTIPVPDGSLDAVLINDGVRLWPDLLTGFTEVSRVLGPAGRMVLALDDVAGVEQAIELVRDLGFAVAIDEADGSALLIANRV